MKLFETMLDIVLMPVAVAKDVATAPVKLMDPFNQESMLSSTREQAQKVDKDLED